MNHPCRAKIENQHLLLYCRPQFENPMVILTSFPKIISIITHIINKIIINRESGDMCVFCKIVFVDLFI